MKPPICACCHLDFRNEDLHSETSGGLVRFVDYEPLPKGMVGHPKGLAWFCATHIGAAHALRHLALGEALRRMKSNLEK